MSDESVARALRSDHRLVVIEAPAGCGKTWQGATYARDAVPMVGDGRLLILAHTHAACDVFAKRTSGLDSRVEIRTIDALIAQIGGAYHRALGLPSQLESWAWKNDGEGFAILAQRVAAFLRHQPMVATALAHRYPLIICDEYQDCSLDQHRVVIALLNGGARLRIFGDPMQRIYGQATDRAIGSDRQRWEMLKATAACEQLDVPHRWADGCPALGRWILYARRCLEKNLPIDLNEERPGSLTLLPGDNISKAPGGFRLSGDQGKAVRGMLRASAQLMILATTAGFLEGIRAHWGRAVPIWEGHTRKAFGALVEALSSAEGDPMQVAESIIAFMGSISAGFSNTSHGNAMRSEIETACHRRAKGGRQNIQTVAKLILDEPNHRGAGAALRKIGEFRQAKAEGFKEINVDYWTEFRDAIRLADFPDPEEAFAEIARQRSRSRRSPPDKVLSTIHKAKGMECENAMLVCGNGGHFSRSQYSKFRLYVALSRAKRSLTLVLPSDNAGPWFALPKNF